MNERYLHVALFRFFPLLKNLYKIDVKYTQNLYKLRNLYIFCIQRLYKSKFCMIMNVQKIYQNFVKFEDQSFYTQKDSQMNLYHRFIFYIMLFIFFVKFVFFYILFIKIQVIFINFLVPYFPAKKSGKMYFLKHSQQDNQLSHRLMFSLPQQTMFSASGWKNNTTSSFLLVNW